jgi:hypothetical protein
MMRLIKRIAVRIGCGGKRWEFKLAEKIFRWLPLKNK